MNYLCTQLILEVAAPSGFWLWPDQCLYSDYWTSAELEEVESLERPRSLHVFFVDIISSAFYPQMSTIWLSSSYNSGPLKLSISHGACRGWAKEAVGVSLVEVGSLSFATTASANI